MRKSLPLWFAAVVPSMLVGHAAGYALSGLPLVDSRHAWLAPTLECSAAALAALCMMIVASAVVPVGIFTRTKIERSAIALWPRLAVAQLVLFSATESVEAHHITLIGVAAQIAAALCAAYVLSLFSRFIERCMAGAAEASRYLQRLLQDTVSFARRDSAPRAVRLFACAGHSRFQRPPPFA